jgi:hypothetical protein
MTTVHISSSDQIPPDWGAPRVARRRSTVAIREPEGVETFVKPWGELAAQPGQDWVIVEDSGDEYPIKKAIFAKTYEAVSPGRYRRSARSRLVQVPEGWVALLATLEGGIEVRHPDYVVIGADDEVYANSQTWVEANLEFIE